MKLETRNGRTGVIAFGTVLILGAIITEIAIVGSFLAYLLNKSNYGTRLSGEALAAARAGIDDGVAHILKQRLFPTCTLSYSITAGNATADVVIQNTVCSANGEGYTVTATGKSLTKRRKLQAVVDVDPLTRESRVVSSVETSL